MRQGVEVFTRSLERLTYTVAYIAFVATSAPGILIHKVFLAIVFGPFDLLIGEDAVAVGPAMELKDPSCIGAGPYLQVIRNTICSDEALVTKWATGKRTP